MVGAALLLGPTVNDFPVPPSLRPVRSNRDFFCNRLLTLGERQPSTFGDLILSTVLRNFAFWRGPLGGLVRGPAAQGERAGPAPDPGGHPRGLGAPGRGFRAIGEACITLTRPIEGNDSHCHDLTCWAVTTVCPSHSGRGVSYTTPPGPLWPCGRYVAYSGDYQFCLLTTHLGHPLCECFSP